MNIDLIILYAIALFQLLHLVYYIIKTRRTHNYFLDFWSFTLLISNVYFYPMFYPFAKSLENEKATGDSIYSIINYVDNAFIITCVGYLFLWIGKYTCLTLGSEKISIPIFRLLSNSAYKLFNSNFQFRTWLSVFIPLIIYVIVEALRNDNIFDVRTKFGSSDSDRPLYNIASIIFKLFIEYVGIIFLQEKRKSYLILGILLLVISPLFGSRSIAFMSLINVFFVFQALAKRKIKLHHVVIIVFLILSSVLVLGGLRSSNRQELSSTTTLTNSLIYGNNFSDLRDFAWVLSKWNNSYYLGSTYISGVISFIPSGLSEYRMSNSIGRVTTSITGLTGGFHGGLRITIFGEPYLNFGYLGVILVAFLFGFSLEYLNFRVMNGIRSGDLIYTYSLMLIYSIIYGLVNTSGFFTIYIIFIPILFIRFLISGLNSL